MIAHSCKDGVNSGNLIQEIRLPVIYICVYIYIIFFIFLFFHDDKLGFGGPKRKSRNVHVLPGWLYFLFSLLYI